jgi:K+-sensing histidine kinase KdpD
VPQEALTYAVAALAVAAATIAGLAVDSFLHSAPFVSLFLCAILFAAWLGGAGPGLAATGHSILAFQYYFVAPSGWLSGWLTAQDASRIALFALTALFVVWLSAAQRGASESLRRARDDLQATVCELAGAAKRERRAYACGTKQPPGTARASDDNRQHSSNCGEISLRRLARFRQSDLANLYRPARTTLGSCNPSR